MTQNIHPRVSTVRTIVGIIIGLAVAALAPVTLALSGLFFVYPILAAVLFAYGGIVPAMVSLIADTVAFDLYFGTMGAMAAIVAFVLPSAFIIRSVRFGRPFKEQLIYAAASCILGVVASLAIIRISLGKDIVDALSDGIRLQLEALEPGLVDVFLGWAYRIEGIVGRNLTMDQLANGVLDAAQRAGYVDAFLSELRNIAASELPGLLLRVSTLTALTAVLLSNYMLRRVEGREGCYIPVSGWYIPWQITAALLGTLAVFYAVSASGSGFGGTVYATLVLLAGFLFRLQTAISLERRTKARGMRTWLRIILIGLVVTIAGYAAVIYGLISALAGSTGVFKQLRDRRGGDTRDD